MATRDELLEQAKALDIEGRSSMNKDQLEAAIAAAEAGGEGSGDGGGADVAPEAAPGETPADAPEAAPTDVEPDDGSATADADAEPADGAGADVEPATSPVTGAGPATGDTAGLDTGANTRDGGDVVTSPVGASSDRSPVTPEEVERRQAEADAVGDTSGSNMDVRPVLQDTPAGRQQVKQYYTR